MIRGIKALALVVLFVMGATGVNYADARYDSGGGAYVGSANGYLYHKDNCGKVGKIKPNYRVHFKSIDDALRMGYRPCKVCRPPVKQQYLKPRK